MRPSGTGIVGALVVAVQDKLWPFAELQAAHHQGRVGGIVGNGGVGVNEENAERQIDCAHKISGIVAADAVDAQRQGLAVLKEQDAGERPVLGGGEINGGAAVEKHQGEKAAEIEADVFAGHRGGSRKLSAGRCG